MSSGGPDRLFRGYGPLIGFTAIFLALAVLVPSQQREVRVEQIGVQQSSEIDEVPEDVLGGGEESAEEATPDDAAPETTVPEAAPDDQGAQPAQPPAATGAAYACPGDQIPGDPYSPPCRNFPGGDNGGATARGVTADRIVVTVRDQAFNNGMLDALSKVARAAIPDESPETITRTINGLVDYFNANYEFYGRKLDLQIYGGKGDVLKELTGGGHEGAEADALRVEQEIKAFADISAVSPVYANALAARKVINIGVPFTSREWMQQRAPYSWSQFPDCSTIVESVASYYVVKMANKPAAHAAGPLKGQTRKLGLIAPENSWYQECVQSGLDIAARSGVRPALREKYRLDLHQMSIQAGSLLTKLKSAGITTVMCGCDPLLLVYLTGQAKAQNYNPEWLITGVALVDNDLIGSIMDPSQWPRAFGVSFTGPQQPGGRGLGYRAYKSVRKDEPSFAVELIYNQLMMLAIGIHMAGPDLTPEKFAQGMFDYPARLGPSGTWGFKPGDYTTADDAREVFWDPSTTSIETRKTGTYIDSNGGKRFPIGQWPATAPRAAG